MISNNKSIDIEESFVRFDLKWAISFLNAA